MSNRAPQPLHTPPAALIGEHVDPRRPDGARIASEVAQAYAAYRDSLQLQTMDGISAVSYWSELRNVLVRGAHFVSRHPEVIDTWLYARSHPADPDVIAVRAMQRALLRELIVLGRDLGVVTTDADLDALTDEIVRLIDLADDFTLMILRNRSLTAEEAQRQIVAGIERGIEFAYDVLHRSANASLPAIAPAAPLLHVAAGCELVCIDSEVTLVLSSQPVKRALVRALIDQHVRRPGTPLHNDELRAAVWRSSADRVTGGRLRTALWSLRKAGLAAAIESGRGWQKLRDDVRVELCKRARCGFWSADGDASGQ